MENSTIQDRTWYTSSRSCSIHNQAVIFDENTGENIAVAYDAKNAPLIAAAPELLKRLTESNKVLNLILSNPANNLSETEMNLIGDTLRENEAVIQKVLE